MGLRATVLGRPVCVAGPAGRPPALLHHRAGRARRVLRLPARGRRRHLLDPARRGRAARSLLGTSLAALVSFFEFPGRRWIEWALVLPLAMPGYVFTLFALGLDVPGIRSTGGAVCVFTLVLYPYVYLLARAAFLSQSRTLIEAARGLGMSRARAILRVGVPLARPAILGGVALALMEALADFGTVNLLGVRTFTDAIYRVWFEAFDRDAAMQLATLLVSVTLTLLVLERLARGRARHAQLAARGDARAAGAAARPSAAAAAVLVPARARGARGGRAARAARRLVGRVDPRRPPAARVRRVGAQQPAAGRDERRARAAGRRCCSPTASARAGSRMAATAASHRYDRLRPAGLGRRRGGDRAARLARPPPRRSLRHGTTSHGHGDRTLLRLSRALPRPRLGRGRVEPPAHPAPARRGRARPRRRPARRARARARAAAALRARHGGAARLRRGDEGAAGHAAPAAARRRHARDRRLAGHDGVAVRDRRAAGADDRAGRPAAGGADDPAVGPDRRERGGGVAGGRRRGSTSRESAVAA